MDELASGALGALPSQCVSDILEIPLYLVFACAAVHSLRQDGNVVPLEVAEAHANKPCARLQSAYYWWTHSLVSSLMVGFYTTENYMEPESKSLVDYRLLESSPFQVRC